MIRPAHPLPAHPLPAHAGPTAPYESALTSIPHPTIGPTFATAPDCTVPLPRTVSHRLCVLAQGAAAAVSNSACALASALGSHSTPGPALGVVQTLHPGSLWQPQMHPMQPSLLGTQLLAQPHLPSPGLAHPTPSPPGGPSNSVQPAALPAQPMSAFGDSPLRQTSISTSPMHPEQLYASVRAGCMVVWSQW